MKNKTIMGIVITPQEPLTPEPYKIVCQSIIKPIPMVEVFRL